jgi:hypothetical protein
MIFNNKKLHRKKNTHAHSYHDLNVKVISFLFVLFEFSTFKIKNKINFYNNNIIIEKEEEKRTTSCKNKILKLNILKRVCV